MKRRNFFKNLIASTVGIFAVSSKPAKAHSPEEIEAFQKAWFEYRKQKQTEKLKQTTLRFNENRIEAWNGEIWVMILEVLKCEEPPIYERYFTLYISPPTAEQRVKLNNDVGGFEILSDEEYKRQMSPTRKGSE